MKPKLFGRLAASLVLLLSAATATAHDFAVDGIYYNKDDWNNTASVTYKGKSVSSYVNEYSGSVTIPSLVTFSGKAYSVTSIGKNAFNRCSGLTAVEIPNSVTSIGEWAFAECSGLTAVEISSSVTSIEYGAFKGCSGLTSVEIPNSVTYIGSSAFKGCSGLTSVEIPNSVTYIGSSAFKGCSGLYTITVQSGNQTYDSRDNCNAIIKTATNTLHAGCKSTIIPSTITSISNSAFDGCSGLKAVEIPNSVTSIGDYAFEDCSGLTAIEIPNSVTSIGDRAFDGCSGLKAVSIGNSVTSIGNSAFYGCSSLTRVDITDIEAWCNITFGSDESNPLNYAHRLYLNGAEITNFIIPNTTTKINDFAFSGGSGLTAIEMPNSVTSIGNSAFSGCSGLKAVSIGNSVTSVGNSAFSYCSGLEVVSIGNSVASIGYDAFRNCDNLRMVVYNAKKCTEATGSVFSYDKDITFVIGAEVQVIWDYVLYNSSSYNNEKVVSHATTPPVITSNTFSTRSCPLYVPKEVYSKYWAADGWSEFADIKEIENPVTKIELNKGDVNLATNSIAQLIATITPSNATLNDIYWSSDAPTVASVDQSGNVIGLKTGMATITAEAIDGSGVKATCRISVGEIFAENLSLNPSELTLAINQSAKIMPVITPENVSNKTVEWSTSNTNVAPYRTNSDGTISVLGAADGVATITCRTTDGSNLTATCTITVGTGAVDGIEADAVKVRGENGVIRIEGAEGAMVEVYNAAGVCVFSGVATEIPVAQRGIYVVKVAGRATKIAL